SEVCDLCAHHGSNGVILFTLDRSLLRTRVFTTSLGGGEDVATGGAALALASLLAWRGLDQPELSVLQGGEDPVRQGHMALRFEGSSVALGAEVVPLLEGCLL